MMSDKLSAILNGQSFPPDEIRLLIKEIENDRAEASKTLESLNENIQDKRLAALGGPVTKEIKTMETEAHELGNLIETMTTAIEKLQDALKRAVDAESADSIRQIDEELVSLEAQKQALLPEFFKSAARAFSLNAEIFGQSELTISKFSGPVRFWPREMQADFFDHLEQFGAGREVIPHKVQTLQGRKKFLQTRA